MKTTARLIERRYYVYTFEFEKETLLSDYIDQNKNNLFDIDIKIYKKKRTLTQLAFVHVLFQYGAQKLGMSKELIKQSIKELYGYREQNIFKPGQLVLKSLSEYAIDEITVIVNGCFVEFGEQGVDMREFIIQWQKIRMARRMKNEK